MGGEVGAGAEVIGGWTRRRSGAGGGKVGARRGEASGVVARWRAGMGREEVGWGG